MANGAKALGGAEIATRLFIMEAVVAVLAKGYLAALKPDERTQIVANIGVAVVDELKATGHQHVVIQGQPILDAFLKELQ